MKIHNRTTDSLIGGYEMKILERSQSKILQYAMPELLMVVDGKNNIVYDSLELLPLQRHSEQWNIPDELIKEIVKSEKI